MPIGQGFLVPLNSTGALARCSSHAARANSLLSSRELGLNRAPRGMEGEAALGLSPAVDAGACPKCGRRKVKRKHGRRWCPKCGQIWPEREVQQ